MQKQMSFRYHVKLVIWLVSIVLLLAQSTKGDCAGIIALNLTSFQAVFHDCGAAVLQMEAIKPPMRRLAESLFQSSKLTESQGDFAFGRDQFFFSPAIRPAFMNYEFPPFVAFGMVARQSVDLEVCLGARIPCTPDKFRFVELERHDVVFINPVRARFRVCDPSLSYTGCMLPNDSVLDLYKFGATSFSLGEESDARKLVTPDPKNPVTIGDDDSQERAFLIATEFLRLKRIAK